MFHYHSPILCVSRFTFILNDNRGLYEYPPVFILFASRKNRSPIMFVFSEIPKPMTKTSGDLELSSFCLFTFFNKQALLYIVPSTSDFSSIVH